MNDIESIVSRIRGAREHRLDITIPFDESHLVLNALQEKLDRENPKPLNFSSLVMRCGKIVCDAQGKYYEVLGFKIKGSAVYDFLIVFRIHDRERLEITIPQLKNRFYDYPPKSE